VAGTCCSPVSPQHVLFLPYVRPPGYQYSGARPLQRHGCGLCRVESREEGGLASLRYGQNVSLSHYPGSGSGLR